MFVVSGIALAGRGQIEIRGAAFDRATMKGEKGSDD